MTLKSFTQVEPRSCRHFASPTQRDAVGKISGKEGLRFEGKAIVFEGEEKALQAVECDLPTKPLQIETFLLRDSLQAIFQRDA